MFHVKYRIRPIRVGNKHKYLVERRFLWLFWISDKSWFGKPQYYDSLGNVMTSLQGRTKEGLKVKTIWKHGNV